MKKLLSILTVMILVLAGCSGDAAGDETKVGLVTDTGGVNDKSFNQGTWEGIEEFKKDNNILSSYIETGEQSQVEQNLNASASQNDVVVAAGHNHENPIYNVATANPDTKFILIDGVPSDINNPDSTETLDNVHSFLFREEQAGYLVGYIAGLKTETNVVGFVGGMKIPPVERFGYGFVQGVQDANPDAEVIYNYTGTFSEVGVGKTTASAMYSQGADIIFSAAGGVNTGVIEAAKDEISKGKTAWVIGVDRDMYEEGIYEDGKSLILTSAVKHVGEAAKKGLELYESDKFEGGVTNLGYEDGAVGLPAENPNLEDDIVEKATKALEGTEKVYSTADELKENLTIKVTGEI